MLRRLARGLARRMAGARAVAPQACAQRKRRLAFALSSPAAWRSVPRAAVRRVPVRVDETAARASAGPRASRHLHRPEPDERQRALRWDRRPAGLASSRPTPLPYHLCVDLPWNVLHKRSRLPVLSDGWGKPLLSAGVSCCSPLGEHYSAWRTASRLKRPIVRRSSDRRCAGVGDRWTGRGWRRRVPPVQPAPLAAFVARMLPRIHIRYRRHRRGDAAARRQRPVARLYRVRSWM